MPKRVANPSAAQRKQRARYWTKAFLADTKVRECEICGATPANCHHIDYNDPSRVMWLCDKHHGQTHSQFGRPAPLDWMADIRAAQARIDSARVASRKGRAGQSGSAPE